MEIDLSTTDNAAAREVIKKATPVPEGEQGGRSFGQDAPAVEVDHILRTAEPFRALELTPENWRTEFGEAQTAQTPVGEVKLGEHQYEKLVAKGREKFFGLIKPTLERPAIIIQTPSNVQLFVKAFSREDGSEIFVSVSRNFDGTEAVISSHPERRPRIEKAIRSGRLLYSTALNAPEGTLPKQPTGPGGFNTSIDPKMGEVKLDQPAIDPAETPEFKAWFGDSKVVDDQGKPLVVYHGGRVFDAFKAGPIWTSTSSDDASGYADQFDGGREIKPLYGRMLNPLDLRNPDLYRSYAGKEPSVTPFSRRVDTTIRGHQLAEIVERAKRDGYDGIIHADTDVANRPMVGVSYVFFDPTQLKLADADSLSYWGIPTRQGGNRGTFDPADPSILHQKKRGSLRIGPNRQMSIDLLADLQGLLRDLEIDLSTTDNAAAREVLNRATPAESVDGQQFDQAVGDRLRDHGPVPVVEVSGNEVSQATEPKVVRKEIEVWARANLRGEHANDDTGWTIQVGRSGLDEMFTHADDPGSPRSLVKLTEIIKNAVLVASVAHDPPSRDFQGVHFLYAPVRVDGDLRVARIVIKELTEGGRKNLYDVVSVVIKMPDVALTPSSQEAAKNVPPSGIMSIDQLLAEVKPEHQPDWFREQTGEVKLDQSAIDPTDLPENPMPEQIEDARREWIERGTDSMGWAKRDKISPSSLISGPTDCNME